ncbi:semaphorin-4E [Astyanax mexicanus]|uniref:Semaphorin-4E-like n=1 Tax=Astyanax mexicanus TaxID=7994 RepID=A0A8T2M0T3_ASTMX|nr:semaphorin-4E [Astyanax mexicanus]XP_022519374.2 semaphorin-4E [Astyanax mexicanus]KAG9278208.1 semaphorin-4E-like [Astyanax mexicanus]
MLPLLVLCLCGPAQLIAKQTPLSTARRTVSISGNGGQMFREEGVWNYSTMLLREDLGVVILGAREAIFALDLSNISQKKDMIKWQVTREMQDKCSHKGKSSEIECQNYIRILHKMADGRMYVCGTNAFSPTCDYLSYTDGRLTLENKREDGKGKCPFDPFQRHTSELVDGVLFSATSINFLGSEPVVMRSSTETIRTDFKTSWLNEPNFIGMEHIAEGEQSPEGDDDKIYLFFSETAVEYDSYSKLEVSRVARVCKSDMGGQRTLQRKWTSFVKARLDCPVDDSSLPFLIQDVFRFCPGDWKTCVFYAVFTPQAYTSQSSAVCAYSIADIRQVISEGKFKTPVPVETSFVKWVMYSGDVPFPRPGACINNEARDKGFSQSLDLPDKTLQFIRDRPLMDQAVQPISEHPLLIKQGAAFTRIVVASTVALDGSTYQVMFIGTENGSVLKVVNYNGHTVIIEEVQMFQPTEPVKTLRLSNSTLYAGSEVAAAQMPLSSCGQYRSCLDCVLARDPYCGWNLPTKLCTAVSSVYQDPHSDVIQSLTDGDSTNCPPIESSKAVNLSFLPGNTVKLLCRPGSNLARVEWQVDSRSVISSDAYQINQDGLLILNASAEASGFYTCRSVESSNSQDYVTGIASYELRLASGQACQSEDATVLLPQAQTTQNTVVALQIMVVLLSIMLAALVIWNFYKGHFSILGRRCTQEQEAEGGQESVRTLELLRPADGKIQREGSTSNSNNNHNRRSEGKNTAQQIT